MLCGERMAWMVWKICFDQGWRGKGLSAGREPMSKTGKDRVIGRSEEYLTPVPRIL